MRESLHLDELERHLETNKSKRGAKGVRKKIKLAKLAKRFWSLDAGEREQILSSAAVYIFPEQAGHREDLTSWPSVDDFPNRPGPWPLRRSKE